jgi:hypothetical protein
LKPAQTNSLQDPHIKKRVGGVIQDIGLEFKSTEEQKKLMLTAIAMRSQRETRNKGINYWKLEQKQSLS